MTMAAAIAKDPHGVAASPRITDPGWPWLLAILGAVTLLRLVALAISPSELGFDEAQYWAWSRDLQFGYATKPPLIAWLIAAETGVCGSGAACVRAASPLLHFGTAVLLALAGRRLYGAATGFWTGITYILMPGVALSAALMTTDAILLFFWSLAFLALVYYLERPSRGAALVFALATAAGLYAKYAMIYLPVLVGLAAAFVPEIRRTMRGRDLKLVLLVVLLLAVPNLWWNFAHGFATFTHTGQDNIGWSLSRLNVRKGFEFLFAQFGVAGPVVFGAMLNALLLGARTDRPACDRLLLWLSWPIVLVITVQGFLAQANANWAATAYPAGVILATALMLRHRLRAFLIANLVICGIASAGMAGATGFMRPEDASGPFQQFRQLGGWTRSAGEIKALARDRQAARLVVEGRALTAGLVWALRDRPLPVLAYLPKATAPADQFEIDAPWRPGNEKDGTLIIGIDDQTARAIGAVPVGTVTAPLYLRRQDRLTVYGFAPGT